MAVARHGELGIRDIPMTIREDVDVVDQALCWGDWERKWVERYAPRPYWLAAAARILAPRLVRRGASRTPVGSAATTSRSPVPT